MQACSHRKRRNRARAAHQSYGRNLRYRLNCQSLTFLQLSHCHLAAFSFVNPLPAMIVGRIAGCGHGTLACSSGISCPTSSGETVRNFSSIRSVPNHRSVKMRATFAEQVLEPKLLPQSSHRARKIYFLAGACDDDLYVRMAFCCGLSRSAPAALVMIAVSTRSPSNTAKSASCRLPDW